MYTYVSLSHFCSSLFHSHLAPLRRPLWTVRSWLSALWMRLESLQADSGDAHDRAVVARRGWRAREQLASCILQQPHCAVAQVCAHLLDALVATAGFVLRSSCPTAYSWSLGAFSTCCQMLRWCPWRAGPHLRLQLVLCFALMLASSSGGSTCRSMTVALVFVGVSIFFI